MTTVYLSVIPATVLQQSLATLLGPLSIVALVAVGVTFAVLVLGLIAEQRDARALATVATPAVVVPFVARGRSGRAAA